MPSPLLPDRTPHRKALLLTGVPGVGKTTIVEDVARLTSGLTVRGFYTAEIREGGVRKGFRLLPFGGEARVLAHIDLVTPHRVGRYGVDVQMLEEVAAELLSTDPPADLYLIDEIGRMECMSGRFVNGMRRLLDGHHPTVATLAQRGGGFIAEVRRRPDVTIWEVTRANRDALSGRVLAWLSE